MDEYVDKCRLCLQDQNDGEAIFSKVNGENYARLILSLFQLKLENRSKWPSKACQDCVRVLQSIIKLKVKIHSSDEELKRVDRLLFHGDTTYEDIRSDPLEKPMKDEIIEEEDEEEFDESAVPQIVEIVDYCEPVFEEFIETEEDEIATEVSAKTTKPRAHKPRPPKHETTPSEKSKLTEERLKIEALMLDLNILHCKECLLEFDTLSALNKHAREVHNKFMCSITCCDESFFFKDVTGHMRYHLDNAAFACTLCGEHFPSRHHLRVHGERAHEIGLKHECGQCGRKLRTKLLYEKHLLTHIPMEERELKYPCHTCGKVYTVEASYNYHLKTVHAPDRPHVCETCGQSYAMAGQLNAHMKSAHGEKKKSQCPRCKKYFLEVKQHIRLGCGPKPLVPCDECGKEVKDLRKHKWTSHSGKTFACEVCGKEFRAHSTWRAHVEIHVGRRYKCYFCDHEATSSANRVKHMKQKHAEPYEQYRAEKELSRLRNDDDIAKEESK